MGGRVWWSPAPASGASTLEPPCRPTVRRASMHPRPGTRSSRHRRPCRGGVAHRPGRRRPPSRPRPGAPHQRHPDERGGGADGHLHHRRCAGGLRGHRPSRRVRLRRTRRHRGHRRRKHVVRLHGRRLGEQAVRVLDRQLLPAAEGPLPPGRDLRLLADSAQGADDALSVPFTVTACEPGPGCDTTIAQAYMDTWKNEATQALVGMGGMSAAPVQGSAHREEGGEADPDGAGGADPGVHLRGCGNRVLDAQSSRRSPRRPSSASASG